MKKGNPVIGEVFYDKWAIISVVYFYRDVDGL